MNSTQIHRSITVRSLRAAARAEKSLTACSVLRVMCIRADCRDLGGRVANVVESIVVSTVIIFVIVVISLAAFIAIIIQLPDDSITKREPLSLARRVDRSVIFFSMFYLIRVSIGCFKVWYKVGRGLR